MLDYARQKVTDELEFYASGGENFNDPEHAKEILLRCLAGTVIHILDHSGVDSGSDIRYSLCSTHSLLYPLKDRIELTTDEVKFIRLSGVAHSVSKSSDDRANALFLLILAGQLEAGEWNIANHELAQVLRRELNYSVLREARAWVEQHAEILRRKYPEVIQHFALVDPKTVQDWIGSELFDELPEWAKIKCVVTTKAGLNLECLSKVERLTLNLRRVVYACDALPIGCPMEIVFRNLWPILFDERLPKARNFWDPLETAERPTSLLNAYLDIIEIAVDRSVEQEGRPLVDCKDYLYDFLLIPLLHFWADPPFRVRAENLYRKACQVMGTSFSHYQNEVPLYLDKLQEAIKCEPGVSLDFDIDTYWLMRREALNKLGIDLMPPQSGAK